MNTRKHIDYSELYHALDKTMSADLPQMELYCEIGRAICAREEKGAAVAAAELIPKPPASLRATCAGCGSFTAHTKTLPLSCGKRWNSVGRRMW